MLYSENSSNVIYVNSFRFCSNLLIDLLSYNLIMFNFTRRVQTDMHASCWLFHSHYINETKKEKPRRVIAKVRFHLYVWWKVLVSTPSFYHLSRTFRYHNIHWTHCLFLVLLGIHSGKSDSTVLLMVYQKTWVFYEKPLYILEKASNRSSTHMCNYVPVQCCNEIVYLFLEMYQRLFRYAISKGFT